jgi:hypothetical protein
MKIDFFFTSVANIFAFDSFHPADAEAFFFLSLSPFSKLLLKSLLGC